MPVTMMLEKIFKLKENNTRITTEAVAGTTTFLTMSYIIFVQPAVLSSCGMDFGSVMVATCIASAIACLLTAFLSHYPFIHWPPRVSNVYHTRFIKKCDCGLNRASHRTGRI